VSCGWFIFLIIIFCGYNLFGGIALFVWRDLFNLSKTVIIGGVFPTLKI